jgi:hypothetical protein
MRPTVTRRTPELADASTVLPHAARRLCLRLPCMDIRLVSKVDEARGGGSVKVRVFQQAEGR